ncbi:MAG: DPP IV N-terminal domain-containing protein, partial [Acidobacteriota bacterium]
MIRPVLLRSLLAALLVLAALAPTLAQPAAPMPAAPQPKDEITLERIMADPDWIGNPPEDPYWSDDGSAVYFFKKRLGSEHRDLYRVPIAGGAPALVADADLGRVDRPGRYSHDWTKKVWARQGDIYVKDLRSGNVRQLTRSEAEERDPFFLVGDREVAYRRDKTFFAYDLETGLERQVADLRLAKDPDAAEDSTFLTAEGPRLYRFLREKKAREKAERERARAEQQADPTRPPVPFYLGEDLEITDTELSPAGRWLIVALRKKNADEGKKDKMAIFLTDSGMVETKDVRPIVGTPKPETPKLVLLDLERHEQHALDLSALPGLTDDPLRALREAAEKAREAAKAPAAEEKKADRDKSKERDKEKAKAEPTPRPVRVRDLQWSDDGLHLALQAFSADHKDRWIVEVEPAAAKVVPLERLHDDAWINWYFNDLGWMRDGKALWYLSEESGYSQLYVRPLDGKKRAVTQGNWEVSEVNLSRDGATFFLVTNREHPGVREAYRVPAAGGTLERLVTRKNVAPSRNRLTSETSQLPCVTAR